MIKVQRWLVAHFQGSMLCRTSKSIQFPSDCSTITRKYHHLGTLTRALACDFHWGWVKQTCNSCMISFNHNGCWLLEQKKMFRDNAEKQKQQSHEHRKLLSKGRVFQDLRDYLLSVSQNPFLKEAVLGSAHDMVKPHILSAQWSMRKYWTISGYIFHLALSLQAM